MSQLSLIDKLNQLILEKISPKFPSIIKFFKEKFGDGFYIEEPDLLGRKECPTRSYPVFVNGERRIHLNEIYSIDGEKVILKTAGFSRDFALELFPDINIPYNIESVILISSINKGEIVRKDDYDIPFP